MRVRGTAIPQVVLGAALLLALLWNLAHAAEISQMRLETGPTGTRAELRLDGVADYQVLSLANPDRLVLDLPGSQLRRGTPLPAATGVVRGVRAGQPSPGVTRIVFDLAAPVVALKPRVETGAGGPRLVLEWPGDGPAPVAQAPDTVAVPPVAAATVAAPAGNQPTAPAQTALDRAVGTIATGVPTRIATGEPQAAAPPAVLPPPIKSMRDAGGTRPLVVAIDAGHGGQDTGALGRGGAREKDVTLAIARELARQIDATPGLKSYLTRDSDYFIPLPQRARKAHAARADIFVSIHADSFTSPDARGAGVFVLSTRGASSQRARWLADKENAADVIGGDRARGGDNVLTSVLLDLTQSGNMKASEDAAGYVLGNLDAIGNLHKGEVERANFAVLRTSDNMPAMLVETGFISNPGEEAKLRSKAYQQQLATAILGGINRYFTTQPPPGTLYALRAQASQDGGGTGIGAGGSP
ncbi:MAG: N-acetylmuramoyl-L-alanine amidase [Thermomonas sp.]